jgi:hypothetical protein
MTGGLPALAALAALAVGMMLGPEAAGAGSAAPAALGRLRMALSGTSGGGARSLNTILPAESVHCHWPNTGKLAAVSANTAI